MTRSHAKTELRPTAKALRIKCTVKSQAR